jgi:hypothetical protein
MNVLVNNPIPAGITNFFFDRKQLVTNTALNNTIASLHPAKVLFHHY